MHILLSQHPVSWCLLSTAFFFMAIQQQLGRLRLALSLAHLPVMYKGLALCHVTMIPYSDIWVTVALGATLHTSSLLFLRGSIVGPDHGTARQRLHKTFRIWINFRLLPLGEDKMHGSRRGPTARERGCFLVGRCKHILALVLIHIATTNAMSATIRPLNVSVHDFAPSQRGILPSLAYRDVVLRMVMSVQWIWATYVVFSLGHKVLAMFFVSITGWDLPSDWPPLFGSILEAYTLRRFWGVFWHRLHLGVCNAVISLLLSRGDDSTTGKTARQGARKDRLAIKGLRALLTFLISAVYHAAVNKLVSGSANLREESRFFLSSFAVCLIETVVSEVARREGLPQGRLHIGFRLLGHFWVLFVFFCTVPAWHYPKIYPAANS
ncbi:toxin biosynthesis protein [Colletotrichum plurivorum]|uniref:Toxin biosynthesis protein n=1 Tax=Colletotrichum plurivorum TaxID=2175906 RepID=A0A8H6KFZ7_9PEZI|nr:toxin biosynthesis protein [Colletotrichum plurivorum]